MPLIQLSFTSRLYLHFDYFVVILDGQCSGWEMIANSHLGTGGAYKVLHSNSFPFTCENRSCCEGLKHAFSKTMKQNRQTNKLPPHTQSANEKT